MLAGLIVLCGIFGLAIGSFLNVVIYRVPQGMSIVSPGSACPSCGTTIKGRDNVPLLSWILLRGRCRHCREPISGRYPLVELGCAGLFAGTAARFGFAWEVPAFLVLFAGLLALSVIDVERLILPRVIVWPVSAAVSVMLVLASAMTGEWHDLVVGVICGAIWFALFYAMFAVSPKLLGFGDVRLAPVLGLALGWLGVRYVVLGLFAANFFGAAIGIALIGTHRTTRQQQLPYGVFLALGCAFAVFAGPEIVNSFSRV